MRRALALVFVLGACSAPRGGEASAPQRGWPGDLRSRRDRAALFARLPFRVIRLEQQASAAATELFGSEPAYTLELHRDGTARWTGTAGVERLGEYAGRIDEATFARLCHLLEEHGFRTLHGYYSGPETHLPTTVTTVTLDGGEQVSVGNYGEFGPPELWSIERMIEGVGAAIDWRPMERR